MRHVVVAILALLLLVPAGCGGGEPEVADRAEVNGRFVGTDGRGLGVSVDFVGYDAEKRAIETALQTESTPALVGIVSIVNRTKSLVSVPALAATVSDGRSVPLSVAKATLRRGVVVPLPDPGPYVPVQGALTVYVLFPGRVDEIRGLTMRSEGREPVRLSREPDRPAPDPEEAG